MKKIIVSILSLLLVMCVLAGNVSAFAKGWDTDPVCVEHVLKEKVVKRAGPGTDGSYYRYCINCSYKEDPITVPGIIGVRLNNTTFIYDGTPKTPGLTVRDNKLKNIDPKNYDVKYVNNSVVGKKTYALITFKGRYIGTYIRDFTIRLGDVDTQVNKISAHAVKFTWQKVAGAKYYRIYQYDSKQETYVRIANTANLSYTVKNLKGGTQYYFLVRAYFTNADKKEFLRPYRTAKKVCITTLCVPPKPSASASGNNVNLSWKRVAGASYYRVFRYDVKTQKYVSLVARYGGRTFVAQNQPKGTNYYLVRAYNARGAGSGYSTQNLVKAVVK
ncbi:MAG: hypothetical protein E7517_01015 [Ruminococcaceae bacterium]|nr:hypothetical protein [Oscillospiraceae bacterium]